MLRLLNIVKVVVFHETPLNRSKLVPSKPKMS